VFLALKMIPKGMNLRGYSWGFRCKIRYCSQMVKYCSRS
jgi:hypothetical protein